MPKIIEKNIEIQTQEHLDKNGLYFIRTNQVFARIFQLILALHSLPILFWEEWTKDFMLGWSLLSYKVFNTVDHTILLQKMECIGFKESVIKWFQSYLSNRKFSVTLENVFLDARLINFGVPQGSILGLLLFLIYINYLPQALHKTGSYLYADNTCIFYQDKDVEKF